MRKVAKIENLDDRQYDQDRAMSGVYGVAVTCSSEEMFDDLVGFLKENGTGEYAVAGCPWVDIHTDGDYGDEIQADRTDYSGKAQFMKKIRKDIAKWRKAVACPKCGKDVGIGRVYMLHQTIGCKAANNA